LEIRRNVRLKWNSLDVVDHAAGDGVVLTGGKPGIRALAVVFFIAGWQYALAGEPRAGGPRGADLSATTDKAEYLSVAANCDVVICSYVTKTVICRRLHRACPYQPLPRLLQPQRHKSHVHSARDFL
jgi:hypothetical protein